MWMYGIKYCPVGISSWKFAPGERRAKWAQGPDELQRLRFAFGITMNFPATNLLPINENYKQAACFPSGSLDFVSAPPLLLFSSSLGVYVGNLHVCGASWGWMLATYRSSGALDRAWGILGLYVIACSHGKLADSVCPTRLSKPGFQLTQLQSVPLTAQMKAMIAEGKLISH